MRTIQGLLGRGACPRRELLEKGDAAAVLAADARLVPAIAAGAEPAPEPALAEAA